MRKKLASAFWILGLSLALKAQASLIVDVNDVSILLPPFSKVEELPHYVGLDFKADHGILFSQQDFTDLIRFSEATQDDPQYTAPAYEKIKLVAVRFEPCAKGNPLTDGCHVELRLIFQPFIFLSNPIVDDFAIHLIFELPEDEADDLITAFVDLKNQNAEIKTNGVPLGIHPAVEKQGIQGKFAQGLKDIITRFAGRDRLRDSTATINFALHDWRFVKASVLNNVLTHVQIPFSTSMNMTLTSSSLTNKTAIIPQSTAPDHINRIVDSLGRFSVDGRIGSFFFLPPAVKAQDIDLALRVDNPELNGPGSTDCISCHQASRSLARVNGSPFLGLADGNPNRFVAPANVTPNFYMSPLTMSTYSMRAFGYSNSTKGPEITQGVVNSSMDVADKINQYLAQMRLKPKR